MGDARERRRQYQEAHLRELEEERAQKNRQTRVVRRAAPQKREMAQGNSDGPRERATYRFAGATLKAIDREAEAVGISRTRVVELALLNYLGEPCPTCGQSVPLTEGP